MGKGIVKLGDSKWATKDGNLLAYKETNNRFTNTEFTFARGTDATYVGEDGLIANETGNDTPRIDFLDDTDGHLLLEPASTNLVTYSEVYGSGTFFSATSGSTIDNTTSISPSGDANATQVTSTGAGKVQSGGLSLTQNTDYVLSFYAKNVDATEVYSRVYATGGSGGSNLTSVDYTSQLSTTEWTRITHIFNTGTNTTIYVYLSNALNSGGTIQLWGAQLEELSYATSYIPTAGTTVTRDAETCNSAGTSADFNSTEGVLYAEIAATSNDLSERKLTLSDGTTTNTVKLQWGGTANQFYYFITDSSGNVSDIRYVVTSVLDYHKVACKWKVNDFALWIDGVEVGTDTSGAVWAAGTLDELAFDNGTGTQTIYSKVKAIKVYKEALSDLELEALTT